MRELNVAQPAASACASCAACGPAKLKRFGVNTGDADYVVALAGNPNTGKTTIFNALTGLRQHVGNWPGKTVIRAEGAFLFNDKKFKLIDLPGTYSLLSNSADEEVARDFLLFGQPDVTAIVADASALERNLNLVLQVLEITDRAVVALNLTDEAERNGILVDDRALARDLGVPIVPMAARRGKGIQEFLKTLAGVATGEIACSPRRVAKFDRRVEAEVSELVTSLERDYPGIVNARWIALRLLEGDESIIAEIKAGTLGEISHGQQAITEMAVPA
jgi:Fe2+ transport system protein B